jgi:hypothetical protein
MINSSAPADSKYWDSYVDSNGTYHARIGNDALNATVDWMTVTRTAATVTGVNLAGTVSAAKLVALGNLPNTAPTVSCVSHNVASGTPVSLWFNQQNAVNERMYDQLTYGHQLFFRTTTDDGVTATPWLTVTRAAAVPTNAAFGCNISITGTLSATGAKNFVIVHPLDEDKLLTHTCIEGPEAAVFYRGEGQTDASGIVTITLPDYFEALTLPDRRTVLLTELFEDEEIELSKLAASRVADGKFRVRSEFASTKFYWEVKAIRSDIEEIEVVSERTDYGMHGRRNDEAGANGVGTSEDGEHSAEVQGDGTTDGSTTKRTKHRD